MATITRPVAIANSEIAFLAWGLDVDHLPGCLGFHIVREHLDDQGTVAEERPLASYVAFRGQRNPEFAAQNTTVWPIQKFTWRDLTVRRRRDSLGRRVDQHVRYRIRAVGEWEQGLERVQTIIERSAKTGAANTYVGTPVPLGYLTPPAVTNDVWVTPDRPPFTSAFTNGILSTQFLVKVLNEDGVIASGELKDHLTTPGDPIRRYLTGDVLPTIHEFFAQPGGRFHVALYELDDTELEALLVDHADRLDLILSDAGRRDPANGPPVYDTRNAPARARLAAIAAQPGSTFTLRNRLFNGSGHIGHNKFVVHVDDAGVADSVLTGSTNWTWSGVCGQTNNCIRIDDPVVARAFLDCWRRLDADVWPEPVPTSAKAVGAGQSDPLKVANETPVVVDGPAGSIELWFSPNVPGRSQPSSSPTAAPPPDMDRLFDLMRSARRAIFFLVFLPSVGGKHSIVEQAVNLGTHTSALDVVGAISDAQAMWDPAEDDGPAPRVFQVNGVSVVLATALTDKTITGELGDFRLRERLAAEKAIIHDKILVLDPMDPEHCVVAFGSHNLGYKASFSNDENLVIVRRNPLLAQAYAAHVLDVYDHYRFRAAAAVADADPSPTLHWDGFLSTNDTWQAKSSHRLADYFTATP